METSRFFVADLPINTTEQDLRHLFQDYGQINNIELKAKQNLVDPDDIKRIAFVTLSIGAQDAQYCLKDLNWQKIRGQRIKVTWAKESFLERLKREREEEQRIAGGNDVSFTAAEKTFEQQSELFKAPLENKRKIFDVDGELDDDEVPAELMISKKRAASSMHNGKIVIQQSFDVEPIHVIDAVKHKKKKQTDTPISAAEQKRKESLNKMKNQYEQNKIAIQKALQGENAKPVNKIKFSDAESEGEDDKSFNKAKTDIFGSDDEEEEDNKEFDSAMAIGKKGEKLAQMQAHQSLDPRFRIDAKFVDEDEEECENAVVEDVENEREWQMNILEQVVGRKLDAPKSGNKTKQNKKMLRYDPSKDDHQQFERSTEKEDSQLKKPKQKDNKAKTGDQPAAEVSKEVFYVVSDSLQQSLRTRGEGFSLLNMFGRDEQQEQRDEQLKQLGQEKILVNSNKALFQDNPFSYDSSSGSETDDVTQEQENVGSKKTDQENAKKSNKKQKFTMESFFIPKNDIRLKEGAKFFIYKKSDDAKKENYEEVRNRLKLLIKTKITKTKKNLANAGYKGKRKV